ERFETYLQALDQWFDVSVYSPSEGEFVAVFEVITERKFRDQEQDVLARILTLLSGPDDLRDCLSPLLAALQTWSGCGAVGLRLQDGEDFPYFETRGFPPEFVEVERHLCDFGTNGQPVRDALGNPVLACMCGNVLCGRCDPTRPFFTARGSFWSNSTTALLASTSEADRGVRTRNRCNGEGYESVALVPLRCGGQILGLLQFNDPRPGRFTAERIARFEGMADQLALALSRRQATEALRRASEDLEAFFATGSDLFVITGLGGDLRKVNRAWEAALGYSAQEALGMSFQDLVHPEDLPAMSEALGSLRSGGKVQGQVIRCRRKDGAWRWTAWQATSQGDAIFASASDITERRLAEADLQQAEERLRLATQAGRIGVWDWDVVQDRLFWDDSMYSLYGLRSEDFSGAYEAWAKSLLPEDRAYAEAETQAALQDGHEYRLEFRIVRPGGEVRVLQADGRVFRAPDGRPLRMIGTNLDITERREAERRQKESDAALQHLQRMESIGRLAGGVAHDMNNVLAAIMSAAYLQSQSGGAVAHQADLILQACLRGRNLIKGLMEFARKEVREAEVLDLNELVRKEAEILGSTTLKRIDIRLDLEPALPRVAGSPTALSSALMNLCVNALDAMPEGGTLTLSTKALEGGHLELVVQDTGSGMPPDVLRRAQEPYFTTKPFGKGTGLGLSTVFGTVQAHGGTLELDSRTGEGTRVRIQLPVALAMAPTLAEQAQGVPAPALPAMRILLVDDDPQVRQSTYSLLESLGHRIIAVSGGREAMELLAEGAAFHAVLMD
ncbi:MAG TPA: PAS domain-containing protein, partial [Holophagaceae bacterium]